jgi:anti-sigma regulatory factor (Ser/Thr protein kinase)
MVYLEARDDLVATAAYQPVPTAAAAARRFVRDTLGSWGLIGNGLDRDGRDALVDDAVLLTSELVTNAVLHAGTPVQVTCRLLGDDPDRSLEIAVLDRCPAQLRPDLPHGASEAAERTNGRGLQLPSELASAWGVTYAREAKAVWFRIDLAGWASQGAPGGHGGLGGVPGPPLAAVPGPLAAVPGAPVLAATAAQTGPGRDAPASRAGVSVGVSGFDDLLVSTVESARDTIGADAAYLLHAAEGGELRVRAAAAEGRAPPAPGRAGLPASAARALARGALSLVTVPLMVDGRVTGVLAAAAAEPGRFSESDASRLQDLANRSALALEQARLSAVGPA